MQVRGRCLRILCRIRNTLSLQQLESDRSNNISWSQLRGLCVDVETAVVDAGVLALVEEVVEFQLQVDVFQLELGGGVAEPGVAVLGSQVVVIVLHSGSKGELLGHIDVHLQPLGGRTHGLGKLIAVAVGLADVP